jgi:hypothetical protein
VAIKGSLITADPNQSLKNKKGGSSRRETASAQRRSVGIYRETRLSDKAIDSAVFSGLLEVKDQRPVDETKNR